MSGRDADAKARIDAVIVNWNGAAYLPRCIEALRASTVPVRIRVVDNASTDASLEYLWREAGDVDVVALPENRGYAAGANEGLERGASEYAIVLNPDVFLDRDYLRILMTRTDGDPEIGVAQGKLYQATRDEFLASCLETRGLLDSTGHRIARTRMVYDRGQGRPDGGGDGEDESVFSACGAALFLRRSMLDQIATAPGEYFDEAFFAYKEDIDLCWRARIAGWDIRYVPEAVAWHVRSWAPGGARPEARVPARVRQHSWMNHWLLMLKNDRLRDLLRDLPWIAGWEALRLGHALLRDPALLPSYARVWRRVPGALRQRRAVHARGRIPAPGLRRWTAADSSGPVVPIRTEAERLSVEEAV